MKNIAHLVTRKTQYWVIAAAASLATVISGVNAGTLDTFSKNADLTAAGNYSTGLPTNASDVNLTTTTAALTLNTSLSMESLTSPGTTSYTISNTATGSSSVLTLGNGSTFTNVNDSLANDLIALTGTKNLTISGASGTTGALGLALASSGNFDVSNSKGMLTISSNITEVGGSRSLTFDGVGTTALSGTNSFSGGLNITAGEVDVSGDGSLGSVPTTATGDIVLNGGRLGSTADSVFTINANRTILLGSAAGTSISVKFTNGPADVTYNGSFQDLSTGGVLVKQGAGILDLGGVSTYTGSTSINNGTLRLNGANLLPAGTVMNLGQASSSNLGTFDLNGNAQTVAGLASTVGTNTTTTPNVVTSATAATLTINTAGGASYSYSGGTAANSGVISGAVALVKSGTGTQILGGANTYTGGTQVTGGVLQVSNASGSSATGTGAVTVSNAGSLLGTGFINAGANSVTVNGILSPGAGTGSAGTINIASTAAAGALPLSHTSTLAFDITSTSSKDLVALGGSAGSSLALNGGTLALSLPNTSSTGINYASTYAIATGVSSLTGTGFGSVTGYDSTDYTANLKLNGTEYDLTFTAVPEPATVAGGVLMVIALGWSQRRRPTAKRRA